MHYEKKIRFELQAVSKVDDAEDGLSWLTHAFVARALYEAQKALLGSAATEVSLTVVELQKGEPTVYRACRPPTGGTGAQTPEFHTVSSKTLRERIEELEDWAAVRDEERCAKSDPSHRALVLAEDLSRRVRAIEERLEKIGNHPDKASEDNIRELSEEICKHFEQIITGGNFLAAWHKLQHTLCCEESA